MFLWFSNVIHGQPKDYFSVLNGKPAAERYRVTHNIYDSEIMLLDSATGVGALKQLDKWAKENDDRQLKIVYLALMGDFHKELYKTRKALEYLNEALVLAIKDGEKNLQAEIYNNLGLINYHELRNYPLAFEYMLKANNIIQNDIGFGKYIYSSRFLYDLGFMYYDFGNYPKAKVYELGALKYPFRNTIYSIRSDNTLGLIYRDIKMFDSANFYFKRALDSAQKINHQAWTGILQGNLGAIYYFQKNYAASVPLLKIDYQLSKSRKQWLSAANTCWMLADINIEMNNLGEAEKLLAECYSLYQSQKDTKTLLSYSLKKAKLCRAKNDLNCAYAYLDSARTLQEEITKKKDAIVFSQAEQKMIIEQHLANMAVVDSENSKKLLLRNSVIVFVLLLLVIAGQFILKQQLKHRKNREILENAKNQLNYYIASVKDKNLLIEQFQQEIEHLNSIPDNIEAQKEKSEISSKLKKYTILTEEDWNDFRHLFEKVYSGFFEVLKKGYPQLTQAEVRLLSLIKLNLSKKEMAEMLGISPDSINKTSQRIRKKINLQEHVQLEELVANL